MRNWRFVDEHRLNIVSTGRVLLLDKSRRRRSLVPATFRYFRWPGIVCMCPPLQPSPLDTVGCRVLPETEFQIFESFSSRVERSIIDIDVRAEVRTGILTRYRYFRRVRLTEHGESSHRSSRIGNTRGFWLRKLFENRPIADEIRLG